MWRRSQGTAVRGGEDAEGGGVEGRGGLSPSPSGSPFKKQATKRGKGNPANQVAKPNSPGKSAKQPRKMLNLDYLYVNN